MLVEFFAMETGFADGVGGASNAAADDEAHYVLFGRQRDSQHPELDGVYFEFDDQINGNVNVVRQVIIAKSAVTFELKDSNVIRVIRTTDDVNWNSFVGGVTDTFDSDIVKA